MEAHNFDINNIVTPIKVEVYEEMLRKSGFPEDKAEFLIRGFKHGFDIGYRGPRNVTIQSRNMRCRVGTKTDLWNMVMAEVKEARYAGPFLHCPFDNYICSPLGRSYAKQSGLLTNFTIK